MSIKVTIADNPVDKSSWKEYETDSLIALLKQHWPDSFPESARIYCGEVIKPNDVTPGDEASYEALKKMEGPFFVALYPEWQALPYIIAAVIAIASILLIPSIPSVAQRNQNQASPNNDLSDRSNKARINGRIEDIYGQVRSVPSLISAPYKVFENNNEIEYSMMCIGRGHFDISDVRDGETKAINIPGTSVMIYSPFTSPNSGHDPQYTIGTRRKLPVLQTKRNNSVNGQVLRPPNVSTFEGNSNVRFRAPNIIELTPGSPEDFTQHFVNGDIVSISDAVVNSGVAVTEKLKALATVVTLRQAFGGIVATRIAGTDHYDYNTSGGALLFELGEDADVAAGLFAPGESITITQTKGDSRYSGVDLSGTYTVASVGINSTTPNLDAANTPKFFIVKLSSPAGVNADWSELYNGTPGVYDFLNQAGKFEFDIAHAGAAVDYDLNLDGTGYIIVSVTKNLMVIDNPAGINAEWDDIESEASGVTPYLSPTILSSGEGRWIGPYICSDAITEQLFCNFVAANGLYTEDADEQLAVKIEIEVEVTPVDNSDAPVGDPEIFNIELQGSNQLKETVAVTLTARLSSFSGRCSVRARRITEHDDVFEGNIVDEVRWRDLYSVGLVRWTSFGYVTIIQSVTYATASALAVKERKLNMLVTRKLPVRIGSTNTFTETLEPTKNAADIFVSICRDKYIGNRSIGEIDVANIYDTIAEIAEYFGHTDPTEFCYTFDNDNLSFEETANIVAQALHCIAYRRGNILKLSFEKETGEPKLLFNHRNKIPNSETRTVSFGYNKDNDGVEFTYVNPKDDSIITLFLPPEHAAINPKKVESLGVRNHLQAYFLGWRIWNKIVNQHVTTEFDATQEANLLLRNDRILVADSTRPNTQDGEVIAVDGLELTLSKVVDLTVHPEYAIFLQLTDETIDIIAITPGSAPNKVILGIAPLQSLITDEDSYARTTFIIVGSEERQTTAFLVSEKETKSRMVSTIRAVSYDLNYYVRDSDFINGIVNGGGEGGYGEEGAYTPDGDTLPYNAIRILKVRERKDTAAISALLTGGADIEGSLAASEAKDNASLAVSVDLDWFLDVEFEITPAAGYHFNHGYVSVDTIRRTVIGFSTVGYFDEELNDELGFGESDPEDLEEEGFPLATGVRLVAILQPDNNYDLSDIEPVLTPNDNFIVICLVGSAVDEAHVGSANTLDLKITVGDKIYKLQEAAYSYTPNKDSVGYKMVHAFIFEGEANSIPPLVIGEPISVTVMHPSHIRVQGDLAATEAKDTVNIQDDSADSEPEDLLINVGTLSGYYGFEAPTYQTPPYEDLEGGFGSVESGNFLGKQLRQLATYSSGGDIYLFLGVKSAIDPGAAFFDSVKIDGVTYQRSAASSAFYTGTNGNPNLRQWMWSTGVTSLAPENGTQISVIPNPHVIGSLAVTEAKDTAAFDADVKIAGALAVTEIKDSFSAVQTNNVTLAVTEAKDTAAFDGDVIVSGALATTEAKDTAAFAGVVIAPRRVSITVPDASISETLTNFPVPVDLSTMPAGFWTHLATTDGGDIRVKTAGGTSLPFDLIWIDKVNSRGALVYKQTLTDGVATAAYIHYGASGLSLLPTNDTYGRDAVWSDYEIMLAGADDLSDRTGKRGSMTAVSVLPSTFRAPSNASHGGGGLSFNGSTQAMMAASVARFTSWTMGVSVKLSAKSQNRAILSYDENGSAVTTYRATLAYRNSSDAFGFWNATDGWQLDSISPSTSTLYRLNAVQNGTTNRKLYRDGTLIATGAPVTQKPSGATDPLALYIGVENTVAAERLNGFLSFIYLRSGALSAGWIAAEKLVLATPTSFYTVGSEEPL